MNTHVASITQPRHVVPDCRFPRNYRGLLASLGFVGLVSLAQSDAVLAATAPSLGLTSTYGVVSDTLTNSNTSPQTIINGDVCFTTGPTTPPLAINGTTRTPCPPQVGLDQGAAVANLNGQPCTSLGAGGVALDTIVVGANPPGTFPPGCYSSGGAMSVTVSTTVTLSGAGVYVFRPGGALNTGANSQVILANGACASDVFWAPLPIGATTIGANAALSPTPTFVGNILDAAGITIGHFANVTGRALAFGGTVTTDANTITVPTCAPFGGAGGNAALTPTLSDWALILLCALLATAGFVAMRRRAR
jgi:Ice-binding-like/IPTL-CTERM motif